MLSNFTFKAFFTAAIILCASCVKTQIEPPVDLQVNCNGDSLTEGAGLPRDQSYPAFLQQLLGRKVNNNGIGGQNAQNIAARQGGLPLMITLEGNAFDGSNAVVVTSLTSITYTYTLTNLFLSTPANNNSYSMSGSVAGVKCRITRTATGGPPSTQEVYTIVPDISNSKTIPPNSIFIPDEGKEQENCVSVLWMGRNDVLRNPAPDGTIFGLIEVISKSVAFNKSGKYLVLGVLNATDEPLGTALYNRIQLTNAKLSSQYGSHFVPTTPPSLEEMQAVNYTPTAQDNLDIANGIWPVNMKTDNLHMKPIAYRIIAARVLEGFKKNKY